MLELKNIIKDYCSGDEVTHALKGINLAFDNTGFSSILGPSGCGKTTMLNIIGGLDHYTNGDLIIDGKSTKEFKDVDWDSYRNARIGFVFQSYNLISHLSILDNVSMALSLSGTSSKIRKEKAKEALKAVGLENHLEKKPNQLSGGQMQRVAIARALINNPDIVLADEPTGALDSETSIQVMEILKEISKKRLVIMVTHNRELAIQYSDRIIEMKDGLVVNDSQKKSIIETAEVTKMKNKKTSMSFWTALSSSFRNLFSKKGRTIITSIAGSIGIIGVALVLSISNGMSNFISGIERDTLAGFPLTVSQVVSIDMSMNLGMKSGTYPTDNIFHPYDISGNTSVHKNNIDEEYVDYVNNMDKSYYSVISYSYSVSKNVMSINGDDDYIFVDTSLSSSSVFSSTSVFSEMPNNKEFIETQYDVLAGTYPESKEDLALVVDSNNRIDTSLLDAFGIEEQESFTVSDLLGMSFKVIANDDYYTSYGDMFIPNSDYKTMYDSDDSITITISSIMRVKESSASELLSTGVNYTTALTDCLLEMNSSSKVVGAQRSSPDVNVLTGGAFTSTITYDSIMQYLGGDKTPSSIQIYPKTFEDKSKIKSYLDKYNEGLANDEKIIYTDLSESMSSSISSMVDTVSIILVVFAGISLIVSTVMIGIITYVSVVERTKEIGIMRAIGARKKDILRIFNAEAIIIGFASGVFGVLLTYALCPLASFIVSNSVNVSFTVMLPPYYAIALICLSMILTLIAGFFPSKIASKKDPVVALRTE